MTKIDDTKIFEWYKTTLEIGRYEVEHGRTRFYETTKIHLAIIAGILGLGVYAFDNNEPLILSMAFLLSVFGFYNGLIWRKQIKSSSKWESRWYLSVAEIEESLEFKNTVGTDELSVWSKKEIVDDLKFDSKKSGASPSLYNNFINSFIAFYIILVLTSSTILILSQ